MTSGEVFLELLKPEDRPLRLLKQYEALQFCFDNPLMRFLDQNRAEGTYYKDAFGTTFFFEQGAPGPTPYITEETKVCRDIEQWQDQVHAPDVWAACANDEEGWQRARETADAIRRSGGLVTCLMGTGIFEQLHFLMGFEDTLANFYEAPDEMQELIAYILKYRLDCAQLLIEKLHPDVILAHDDWGSKDRLFMNPDMWRDFFKEPYRQFYGYLRSRDVITVHHGDCFMAPLAEDMVDVGIQVWLGVVPENDIPSLQKQLRGRMVLMGGIGAAIDRADATEEEIYHSVRTALDLDCPGGHFIPCMTYGAPGTVYPHVDPVINRAIEDYNREHGLL